MGQQRLRIMLVEDDSIILLGFKSFISELGHIVVGEAYDGETAVVLAATLSPDLLIMDIKMPKMDGIQALEKINVGASIVTPCLFITAHSDDQLQDRAAKAGAFSYLIKPVSIQAMRAAIEIAMVRYKDFQFLQQELNDTKTSLESRKYVERAKGILMDQFGLKEQQAMEYLQKKSSNRNLKLVDVAKEIIRMNKVIG